MVNPITRLVDISFPLSAATYQNNLPTSLTDRFAGRPIGFEVDNLIGRSDPFSVGQVARGLKMRLHAGSHIDAPEHWIADGAQIQDLPLERFIGRAVLANVSNSIQKEINGQDLEAAIGSTLNPGDRLLIRTDWNDRLAELGVDEWKRASPFLSASALDWCEEKKLNIIGIDFYHGAAAPGTPHAEMFESRFAKAGILTLTNLVNLRNVRGSSITLIAFPLALVGVEASPVRAVVLEHDE
jgi:kynurenine formamidase